MTGPVPTPDRAGTAGPTTPQDEVLRGPEPDDVAARSVGSAEVVLRRAEAADAGAVADVWLASFSDALPTVQRAHDDAEVRGWIASHLVPSTECWVATVDGEVVAMMALSPGWIDQLYVVPRSQGRAIGSALVRRALERQAEEGWEPLQLWTFQVNAGARGFYARHGFHEVELTDGATNEEHEPDVRLHHP